VVSSVCGVRATEYKRNMYAMYGLPEREECD